MPKAYSDDFRLKVIEAYDEKSDQRGIITRLSEQFKIHINTVRRIIDRYNQTGETTNHYHHCKGPDRTIDDKRLKTLRKLVEKRPDSTLIELRDAFKKATGLDVSRSSIHRSLIDLDLRRKKKSAFAEQQETPDVKKNGVNT